MTKQKGFILDQEAIYKQVLVTRENKILYKTANLIAKEKYFPMGYRDIAKKFGCTPQFVSIVVKKFEGKQNKTILK